MIIHKNLLFVFMFFVVSEKILEGASVVATPAVQRVYQSMHRRPQGFLLSPYSCVQSLRYAVNALTNGYFSQRNLDRRSMRLLPRRGSITVSTKSTQDFSPIKIIFLGDIMVSKSGNPPQLDKGMIALLKSADVIIANVESPIIGGDRQPKRGLSLAFTMHVSYLKKLYDYNPRATWIMSVANNHAFDTSVKNSSDITGLLATTHLIKKHMPNAHIVGAQVEQASSVVSLQIKDGPKIGIVAWTDIMNWDTTHIHKPVVRGHDVRAHGVSTLKKEGAFDFLIGFAHGGQEQSYEPLKSTRDRWMSLIGPDTFDLIVGTGPHVVQPAEEIDGRLLFHSIGNFCSPKGSSQTKVGCIPEIILQPHAQQSGLRMVYTTHFLQQQENNVSLFELNSKNALYPDIVTRLKKIWPTLFAQ